MDKYMFSGVVPYNEVYYGNCFYSLWFSAVASLGGNVLWIIANDVFYYDNYYTDDCVFVYYQSNLYNMVEGQLNMLDNRAETSRLIPILENCIKNKLLFVPVDGMYYKNLYHDLFYMKEYHLQNLMVYGFDSKNRLFNIVGINGMNWDAMNQCRTNIS